MKSNNDNCLCSLCDRSFILHVCACIRLELIELHSYPCDFYDNYCPLIMIKHNTMQIK